MWCLLIQNNINLIRVFLPFKNCIFDASNLPYLSSYFFQCFPKQKLNLVKCLGISDKHSMGGISAGISLNLTAARDLWDLCNQTVAGHISHLE